MKRLSTMLLAAILTASALTACAGNAATPSSTSESAAASVSAPAASSKIKTGLAVLTTSAKSTDAGDNDGAAKSDSVVAAVMLGADG